MPALNKYDGLAYHLFRGEIDLDGDTFAVFHTSNAYVPDAAAHDALDDVTNILNGGNVSSAGNNLANITVSPITGGAKFDADDLAILQDASNPTTMRKIVVAKKTGTAATSWLMFYGTAAGSDVDMTAGDVTHVWDTAGIMTSP